MGDNSVALARWKGFSVRLSSTVSLRTVYDTFRRYSSPLMEDFYMHGVSFSWKGALKAFVVDSQVDTLDGTQCASEKLESIAVQYGCGASTPKQLIDLRIITIDKYIPLQECSSESSAVFQPSYLESMTMQWVSGMRVFPYNILHKARAPALKSLRLYGSVRGLDAVRSTPANALCRLVKHIEAQSIIIADIHPAFFEQEIGTYPTLEEVVVAPCSLESALQALSSLKARNECSASLQGIHTLAENADGMARLALHSLTE